jgi:adenosylcobinamide-phosphate synthase
MTPSLITLFFITPFFVTIGALALDYGFKEPKRFHPLVGFGHFANRLECYFNQAQDGSFIQCLKGGLALFICVFFPVGFLSIGLILAFSLSETLGWILEAVILYSCIGMASLFQHVKAIEEPLKQTHDSAMLSKARFALSMIVSRETENSDERQIIVGAMESLLENSLDALFATLFWYWVLGIEGVVIHRLVNTLDAMWGYKSDRYYYFGKVAARFDDVLGFIPARLLALSFALCGNAQRALRAWRIQARHCKSPNGGPVMTAGAGALGVQLGGDVVYQGQISVNPQMGFGKWPDVNDLNKAKMLILKALGIWLVTYFLLSASFYFL